MTHRWARLPQEQTISPAPARLNSVAPSVRVSGHHADHPPPGNFAIPTVRCLKRGIKREGAEYKKEIYNPNSQLEQGG